MEGFPSIFASGQARPSCALFDPTLPRASALPSPRSSQSRHQSWLQTWVEKSSGYVCSRVCFQFFAAGGLSQASSRGIKQSEGARHR